MSEHDKAMQQRLGKYGQRARGQSDDSSSQRQGSEGSYENSLEDMN
jgi:hypothetical protein